QGQGQGARHRGQGGLRVPLVCEAPYLRLAADGYPLACWEDEWPPFISWARALPCPARSARPPCWQWRGSPPCTSWTAGATPPSGSSPLACSSAACPA